MGRLFLLHSCGPAYHMTAESVPYTVHREVKAYLFWGVLKQVQLLCSRDQPAEFNPDQPYHHPAGIKTVQKLFALFYQHMVE